MNASDTPATDAVVLDPFEMLLIRLAVAHRVMRLAEDRRLDRLIPERSSKGHLLWLHDSGRRTP